jgi:transcription elongation factor Elf1
MSELISDPTPDAGDGPMETKRLCPVCGSERWVSISLDQGYTRRAQCVPCGAIHPGVIGPGWRVSR